jgi:hypothetical protein
MFERYTEAARRAIFFAHFEAVHRRERFICAGDILTGLTWEASSRACQIASLKQHAVALRALLMIPHLPSTSTPYRQKNEIPLDNGAKKALAYAAMEADEDREYWLDTDHLLRGLLRFSNNASDALAKVGIKLNSVRTDSIAHRQQSPSPQEPAWTSPRKPRPNLLYGVLLVLVVLLLVLKFMHLL